jgi:hypothetical protein
MQKFIFAYHGSPSITSPEEGHAHMTAWKAWMDELGDAVLDRGLPAGPSKTVSRDGVLDDGGSNPLSGISVVQADSVEAALEMAKISPHVTGGGTIEVAPAMDMEM